MLRFLRALGRECPCGHTLHYVGDAMFLCMGGCGIVSDPENAPLRPSADSKPRGLTIDEMVLLFESVKPKRPQVTLFVCSPHAYDRLQAFAMKVEEHMGWKLWPEEDQITGWCGDVPIVVTDHAPKEGYWPIPYTSLLEIVPHDLDRQLFSMRAIREAWDKEEYMEEELGDG